jgi:hypothetical protein
MCSEIYPKAATDKLINEDNLESIREDQWLEDVFGTASRMQSDEWVQKTATVGNWIFNSNQMRKRIFTEADVPVEH